ncbi:MAG: succinylglutamate desuccinylase/aspartoacylase family protein [Acetobacteraceae bacterium]|nr:succinylglutamate desuccinylase/aspartoacylase family protein [Acetobacteraceae bacterium]
MPAASRIVSEVDFTRDGKQHGYLRLFHSVHASAYGFIPIPVVVIRNGEGPTALFVAGNHGDEYEGQVALANLARRLDPARIRGRVILLPAANLPAAVAGRRTSPLDEGNLNRSFPGDPDGTVTQQIAYYIEHALVPLADLVCDLHSGGSSLMYLPSAQLPGYRPDGSSAPGIAALKAFAAENAYIVEANQGGDRTLAGACARAGVLSLGTEAGGAGHVTAVALRMVERGVVNLLVHLGILPESDRIAAPTPTRYLEVGGAEYYVYAPDNGLYEPLAELGESVMSGQPAARIHFPETPWAEPVMVPFLHKGIVLCKRMPGRTMRGDCLFHLGTEVAV